MNILVIAPHPDDEVLGVGGTIHRLAGQGHHVVVAIATVGWSPLFSDEQVAGVRAEAQTANRLLGTSDLRFLDLPVTRLHELPEARINQTFDELIAEIQPDSVYLPFSGDRHEDHRQVFDACMVALRPRPGAARVARVLAYETVSETHWAAPGIEPAFDPQVYVDISDHLDVKIQAMRAYASQVHPAPDARSVEAVEALARWRGSVVGLPAAETFVLIRDIQTP